MYGTMAVFFEDNTIKGVVRRMKSNVNDTEMNRKRWILKDIIRLVKIGGGFKFR